MIFAKEREGWEKAPDARFQGDFQESAKQEKARETLQDNARTQL